MMLTIRITHDDIYEFIPSDSEMVEILTDLANGDYSIEAYKEDIQEWRESLNDAEIVDEVEDYDL